MHYDRHTSTRRATALVLCGTLLQSVALAGLLLPRLPFAAPAHSISVAVLLAVAFSGIALIAAGLVTMRGSADRSDGSDRSETPDRDLLNTLMEAVPDRISFKDTNGRFILLNQSMAEHYGLNDPADARNQTESDLCGQERGERALADEQEVIRTGRPCIEKEEKETSPDGRETYRLTKRVPVKSSRGAIIGVMGITRDITAAKGVETQVRSAMLHDPLTGLPNRTLLQDRLGQAIALAVRNETRVGVLMLGLNRFRHINDAFGHAAGDQLLQEVTVRLRACLRESDTIARFGDDEFVIVTPMVLGCDDMEHVARKILGAVTEPFRIEGQEVAINGSIGICQFPNDGKDPVTLVQCVDAALSEARKRGIGTCCFFSPALAQATKYRRHIENDLRQACERDQFVVHYQPIISTTTGRITGVEALLRWRHLERGLVPPSQFIPQLEELGLMPGVGRWVLRAACYQAVAWQQDGILPIRMAVNVSAQQLYWANLADTVRETLLETGLDSKWLELELTESQTLDDSDATLNIMQDLKRLGISLSLDDFGVGWSCLSYLRRFPVDRIKIDHSFVRDVPSQPAANGVVRSILSLGHSLGIACIAEGVETTSQRDYLREQSCAEMQGFMFSEPLSGVDCTALLRSSKKLGLKNKSYAAG